MIQLRQRRVRGQRGRSGGWPFRPIPGSRPDSVHPDCICPLLAFFLFLGVNTRLQTPNVIAFLQNVEFVITMWICGHRPLELNMNLTCTRCFIPLAVSISVINSFCICSVHSFILKTQIK